MKTKRDLMHIYKTTACSPKDRAAATVDIDELIFNDEALDSRSKKIEKHQKD